MSSNKMPKSHTDGSKRVLFQEGVTIHRFEADNNDSKSGKSSREVSSKHCSNRDMTKSNRVSNDQSQTNVSEIKMASETRNPVPPSSHSVPLAPTENFVRYTLIRDRLRREILLQLCIPLSPVYGPKGVMVRANLHGTKVRVLACSKESTKTVDGQAVKMEYNETFALPVAVDRNRVNARVDNLGCLMIDAPILIKTG